VLTKWNYIEISEAACPTDLPTWYLRDLAAILCDPLCDSINASLKTGNIPRVLKKAKVIPISEVQPPKAVVSDLDLFLLPFQVLYINHDGTTYSLNSYK
jgi:hypothetical protein